MCIEATRLCYARAGVYLHMCAHLYSVYTCKYSYPRVCCYSPLPPFQGPDTHSLWHPWHRCIFVFLYMYMHVRFYLFFKVCCYSPLPHWHRCIIAFSCTYISYTYVWICFVYVYVLYMCVHIYTCILKSLLLHASSTRAYVYMYIFACMYILYVCIHLYVFIWMFTTSHLVYAGTDVHLCIHIHVCIIFLYIRMYHILYTCIYLHLRACCTSFSRWNRLLLIFDLEISNMYTYIHVSICCWGL